jgi:hypothetical protein
VDDSKNEKNKKSKMTIAKEVTCCFTHSPQKCKQKNLFKMEALNHIPSYNSLGFAFAMLH